MITHRELNPLLFDSPAPQANAMGLTIDSRVPAANVMGPRESAIGRAPYAPLDLKNMETQVAQLKGAMIQMERQTETISFKMEELSKTLHQRLERFTQAVLRLEETQTKNQQETAQRFGLVAAKMNERKVGEMKVQEMMDRHNTIVRNFENRMLSLQRLVTEQEMALHNAQAALNEARSDITRMKMKS